MPCKPRLTGLPATSRPGPGLPWFCLTGQRSWVGRLGASRHLRCFAIFCRLGRSEMPYQPRLKRLPEISRLGPEISWGLAGWG